MKNKKSFLIFSICFALMITGTIIINWNLDKMMPNSTNQVKEYSMTREEKKDNLGVWSRIEYYMNNVLVEKSKTYAIQKEENSKYTTKITNIEDNKDSLIQDIERCFFDGNVETRFYAMENESVGKMVYASFFRKGESATLLYKEDKSLVLYSKYFFYKEFSKEASELISGKKEEILKECEEKVKKLEFDFLSDFKGEAIWRLRDNLYAINDTKNGITINYELSKKEITGFMLEK